VVCSGSVDTKLSVIYQSKNYQLMSTPHYHLHHITDSKSNSPGPNSYPGTTKLPISESMELGFGKDNGPILKVITTKYVLDQLIGEINLQMLKLRLLIVETKLI